MELIATGMSTSLVLFIMHRVLSHTFLLYLHLCIHNFFLSFNVWSAPLLLSRSIIIVCVLYFVLKNLLYFQVPSAEARCETVEDGGRPDR